MGENRKDRKQSTQTCACVTGGHRTTIGLWCWFEDDANCFRGWVPRLGPRPLGRAEEFCQYWLQPVYPGLGRDIFSKLWELGLATMKGMLRSFSPLLTRMWCLSDVMEVCASLTRAELASGDGWFPQSKLPWKIVSTSEQGYLTFKFNT